MTEDEKKILKVELVLDGVVIDRCYCPEEGIDGTHDHNQPSGTVLVYADEVNSYYYAPCKNHVDIVLKNVGGGAFKHWKII